jgi:hypothetical protein
LTQTESVNPGAVAVKGIGAGGTVFVGMADPPPQAFRQTHTAREPVTAETFRISIPPPEIWPGRVLIIDIIVVTK